MHNSTKRDQKMKHIVEFKAVFSILFQKKVLFRKHAYSSLHRLQVIPENKSTKSLFYIIILSKVTLQKIKSVDESEIN